MALLFPFPILTFTWEQKSFPQAPLPTPLTSHWGSHVPQTRAQPPCPGVQIYLDQIPKKRGAWWGGSSLLTQVGRISGFSETALGQNHGINNGSIPVENKISFRRTSVQSDVWEILLTKCGSCPLFYSLPKQGGPQEGACSAEPGVPSGYSSLHHDFQGGSGESWASLQVSHTEKAAEASP